MSSVEHIALNGEREVYVCLNLTKINSKSLEKIENSNKKLPQKYQYPCLKLGGNSIWQIINVPLTYISSNYPIKVIQFSFFRIFLLNKKEYFSVSKYPLFF